MKREEKTGGGLSESSSDSRAGQVVIVGAGAAGMMAACSAASEHVKVILLEKNEKPGKKIYITGKGRCNFTNLCETEDFFEHIPRNPRFLYSSVYGFDPHAAREWFEEHGVRTKVERGNRAFPVSDHASDITRALEREMRRLSVDLRLCSTVSGLAITDGRACGVILKDGRRITSDAVIVATGGLSYPSTGSDGDGLRFAERAGHRITSCSPSLVPMNTEEADIPLMQGLSLKNVRFTVLNGKKKIFSEFGELMFTHFGVTGPLVLSASACIQDSIRKGPLQAEIDLKPALEEEKLDARLLREFSVSPNRELHNVAGSLYPSKMVPVVLDRTHIPPETPARDITRQMRRDLIDVTKHFKLTITSLRGYNEAVITRGGVSVKDVDPSTMESRLIKGLYFAGEVLDVDGFTGGFNLQIAWSTGYAAGKAAAACCHPGLRSGGI